MRKLSVGVIFGGRSVEHEVSIVTAHQLMEVLSHRHDVVPIYVSREGKWYAGPGLFDLDVYRAKRWDKAGEEAYIPPVAGTGGVYVPGGRLKAGRVIPLDVVIPAIHGTFGEDGTLQGLLELADIAYAGSGVVGSAVGMDKVSMKAAFRAAGLPVVDHRLVEVRELDAHLEAVLDDIERLIGFPAFVKPARLGSSVGISRAADRSALSEALEVARRYDRRILVETAMDGCLEINCSVMGGPGRDARVSVCEQPVAWEEFLSFSDKYLRSGKGAEGSQGMKGLERRIPAPIPDELTKQIQENALAAFKAVDAAGVARIDSFVREETGETWVMEINTVPGSFAFYLWEASGVTFEELTEVLIATAREAHALKDALLFSYESGMLERQVRGGKNG